MSAKQSVQQTHPEREPEGPGQTETWSQGQGDRLGSRDHRHRLSLGRVRPRGSTDGLAVAVTASSTWRASTGPGLSGEVQPLTRTSLSYEPRAPTGWPRGRGANGSGGPRHKSSDELSEEKPWISRMQGVADSWSWHTAEGEAARDHLRRDGLVLASEEVFAAVS